MTGDERLLARNGRDMDGGESRAWFSHTAKVLSLMLRFD